jgi:ABC-2 type transport system permease protein
LIGSRIGTISGASYMDYIVPGIILMSVIIIPMSAFVSRPNSAQY